MSSKNRTRKTRTTTSSTGTARALRSVPDQATVTKVRTEVGDGIMFVCKPDHTTAAVNAVIRIQEMIKDAGTGGNGTKGLIDFTCSAALTTGEVRLFTTPNGTPDFVGSVVDKAFRLRAFVNAKAIFVGTATVQGAVTWLRPQRRGAEVSTAIWTVRHETEPRYSSASRTGLLQCS